MDLLQFAFHHVPEPHSPINTTCNPPKPFLPSPISNSSSSLHPAPQASTASLDSSLKDGGRDPSQYTTKTNHTHHIMSSKHPGYWCYPGVENGSKRAWAGSWVIPHLDPLGCRGFRAS
ncbi:uncharacterized protein LACBIDRAFT_299576 [Laccaria bicolor S238N-H82]|uniref:Predicted protein n=1 Tax=Laccaria bicolor (strain S238N-H82 / ATCC MYA-4686) TaxID=486041 RepID=B0DEW6_LACBS|nr:uncharacterized protein LACBIDRAFT_299576 [Laccaria bicolor S238N-H82]EDR06617.1 predicted protein [Laccaria bicolor S238N-H82]|eukprot:XP_001882464.1 predicted protein [Laccaria bicolor S238N-H82]